MLAEYFSGSYGWKTDENRIEIDELGVLNERVFR